MNLAQFLDKFGAAVSEAVIRTYPPLYDSEVRRTCGFDLGRLLRRPLGAQADGIRATALSLQRHRGTIVVGLPPRRTWLDSGGCWSSPRPIS